MSDKKEETKIESKIQVDTKTGVPQVKIGDTVKYVQTRRHLTVDLKVTHIHSGLEGRLIDGEYEATHERDVKIGDHKFKAGDKFTQTVTESPFREPEKGVKHGHTWHIVAMLMLLLALLFISAPPQAQAAAGQLQLVTNAVTDRFYSYYTNYGAAFTMMVPGQNGAGIIVRSANHYPTNVVGSTVTFFTGNTAPLLTVTNAGASGDSAILVASTNGLFATERCILQLSDNTCIELSVSNVISGSNYVAFNETLGATIPVNSWLYPMNQSNVFVASSTNIWNLPNNPFAARYKWPLLIKVSDGGRLNVTTEHTP